MKLGFLASGTGEAQPWEENDAYRRSELAEVDAIRLCCCSAWRSCSKELTNLYALVLSRLGSLKLHWVVRVPRSIIISSSSSSSPDATEGSPHPREGPSKDGANILRRFSPCLDEDGSDESGGDSGMVAWVRGNGDEARCRLSISMMKGGLENASDGAGRNASG